MTVLTPSQIWAKARDAANQAAAEAFAKRGDRDACGFAWVTIRPARGPVVNFLKGIGVGQKAYGGGYQIWYSYLHDLTRYQAMRVHEAAAEAAARVLEEHGVNATWGSRMD